MRFDPSGLSELSDPSGAAVWMAIAVVAVGLGLWFRSVAGRHWNPWWVLAPALAIAGLTLLRVTLTSGIDSDESEHLHVAYAIGQGALPYRDFAQNHSPFLWLLTAPLLQILPETPYVLYLFRALALGSFIGSVAIGCSMAKQLSPGSVVVAPLCAFLALAPAVNAEVYRFRPDAFMNFFALLSLALLLRGGDRAERTRYTFWAGLLQGLAIALSPKLAHLALIAPVILIVQGRHDRGGIWRGALAYAAGGLLAVTPVFLWLGWHGLLPDAYAGIAGQNLAAAGRRIAQVMPIDPDVRAAEIMRLLQLSPFLLLTAIGAVIVLRRHEAQRTRAACLLAAWVLWWFGVWALAPNIGTYHVAGAFVLGAAFGAISLEALLSLQRAPQRSWALGLLLSLCLAGAPLRSGLGGWVNGHTYPLERVAWLLDAVRSRGGGCLCLVPWHPIFVSKIAPVYVSNQRNSPRWGEALEWAAENRPAVITARSFKRLSDRGFASKAQVDRITNILREHYRLRKGMNASFWLLKTKRSGGGKG